MREAFKEKEDQFCYFKIPIVKINYFEEKTWLFQYDIGTIIFNFKSYETASKSLVWHNFLAGDGGWLIDLDGVQEADNIGYCSWKVLMTAAQRRKPKKQKVPDDVLVCKVGIGAGYNVLHSKHLFSKLE